MATCLDCGQTYEVAETHASECPYRIAMGYELRPGEAECLACKGRWMMAGNVPVEILIDWFGDGRYHDDPADYPAPEPHTGHGSKATRVRDGKVLHACGVFVGRATDD